MDFNLLGRLARRHPRWFVISQVLIAAAFPLITSNKIFGFQAQDPEAVLLFFSVVAGLLYAMIMLLIKLVLDRIWFDKVISAAHESDLSTDDLLSFVEAAGGFKFDSEGAWRDFSLNVINHHLINTRNFIRDLKNERVTLDDEDHVHLLTLTKNAKKTIRATSLATVDAAFWSSNLGKKYTDRLVGAVKRKCYVQRVFVGTQEQIEGSRHVILHQQESGMDVRIYAPKDGEDVHDFILFDDQVYYTVTCFPGTGRIQKTEICGPNGAHIGNTLDLFSAIFDNSIPLEKYWPSAGATQLKPEEVS